MEGQAGYEMFMFFAFPLRLKMEGIMVPLFVDISGGGREIGIVWVIEREREPVGLFNKKTTISKVRVRKYKLGEENKHNNQ